MTKNTSTSIIQQEKSIANIVSEMESDEVRNLIPIHISRSKDEKTHADSLKWISEMITYNTTQTIKDSFIYEQLVLLEPLKNVTSYHWKLLKLKGRLDTITECMTKRKKGTLEPYTTYMDEDSTDKIDKFLLMSQVKPLESDDDDMDLKKII